MAKKPDTSTNGARPGKSTSSDAVGTDRTEKATSRIRQRANEIWESEGRPEGRHDDHWLQAEREIMHGNDNLDGDDVPNLAALREAAREHTDAFIVKSDLEDADQRDATPGVREQS